jgi:hypothetical protein
MDPDSSLYAVPKQRGGEVFDGKGNLTDGTALVGTWWHIADVDYIMSISTEIDDGLDVDWRVLSDAQMRELAAYEPNLFKQNHIKKVLVDYSSMLYDWIYVIRW